MPLYGVLVASRRIGITPLVETTVQSDHSSPGPLTERVKILFIARHFTYFRNYETVIADARPARASAAPRRRARGRSWWARDGGAPGGGGLSGVSFGWIPEPGGSLGQLCGTRLRMTIDYLRYLDPAYAGAPKLRARAKERVPRLGLWLLAAAGVWTTTRTREPSRAVLHLCERAIPRSSRRYRCVSERPTARTSCCSRRWLAWWRRLKSTICSPRRVSASRQRCACGAGITCRARR